MKRLHLIILIGLLNVAQGLKAQEAEPGEQLLVFRNTGVVDLLYTNKVDSILTTDSTQVFCTKDTVLVVPLAELDSVAVGSRNEMRFHLDVKELTDAEDLPWIIRFDGQSVYYRNDTPAQILPKEGMKLFYGIEDAPTEASMFPYGLCVRVTAVKRLNGETRVSVEQVGLEDVFSHLFFAGPIKYDVPAAALQRRAPINTAIDLGTGFDIDNVGSVEVKGSLAITGDAIFRIGYQHADLNLSYGYGVDVTLKAKESTSHNYEELSHDANIGTFYKLLNLKAAVGAFADLNAELSFGLHMERTYHRKLLWTRRGNDSSFEFRDAGQEEPYEDKAKFDLTLDGSLFFGPMVRIDFVTIGDLVGARAKVKLGTEITGKVSLGMLQNMRNYESEAYGNAELNFCGKAAVEGYVTNRHYLVWGDVDEHKVFSIGLSFGGYTWKLFPDYTQTTATATAAQRQEAIPTETTEVSVASALPEPTPTDIETGFEIVDPQGEVVDSIFVGTIMAEPEDTTTAQTFESEIVLPPTIKPADLESYTMRPVFHYAGYTVSAAPVGISKDVLLQPYTSTQSNGAMTFISSGPFLDSAVKDSTYYQVGAYLPVPVKNIIYKEGKGSKLVVGSQIDNHKSNLLIGTWHGKNGDEDITVSFSDDEKGIWQNHSFTYELNTPQTGDMLLTFDDNLHRAYVLVAVTEKSLQLYDKSNKCHLVLSAD